MLIPKSIDEETESKEVLWNIFLCQKIRKYLKNDGTYQEDTGVNLKGPPLAKSGATNKGRRNAKIRK